MSRIQKYITHICIIASLVYGCEDSQDIGDGNNQAGEKYIHNPILVNNNNDLWDGMAVLNPSVIMVNDTFRMWYTGYGMHMGTLASRIGYAWSANGRTWNKIAGPVVDISQDNWDDMGIESASVIYDSGDPDMLKRYKMWYCGKTDSLRMDVGYAWSPDGISWTKYPNPVFTVGKPGEWDHAAIQDLSVIKKDGEFTLWYEGLYTAKAIGRLSPSSSIGIAVSNDGINWARHEKNPVLTPNPGTWESATTGSPHVIYNNNLYHMWYTGADSTMAENTQIGYAWSENGIIWNRTNFNPVVKTANEPGLWDSNSLGACTAAFHNNVLYLWYTGKNISTPLKNLAYTTENYFWAIGLVENGLDHPFNIFY